MGGNTVYVQGNYVDVHDNEVVNLSIEKAEVRAREEEVVDMEEQQKAAAVLTENGAFMAILTEAVAAVFCKQDGWQYKWDVKVEAVYFAALASRKFKLSTRHLSGGREAISWKPFEALFGLKDLKTSFNDYNLCKTRLVREEEIDRLFE